MEQIVRRGKWRYDGDVFLPAYVIALDFDYWYEVRKADGDPEGAEGADIGPDGHLYYVCFHAEPHGGPDSPGFHSIALASGYAAQQVQDLSWLD